MLRSRVRGKGSRVSDKGSEVKGHGSRVTVKGSRVGHYLYSIFHKTKPTLTLNQNLSNEARSVFKIYM